MKKENVQIKIVELNNKSRKGTYLYVKTNKNKPSYYLYNETIPVDYYLKHYQEKNLSSTPKKVSTLKKKIKAFQTVLATPKHEIRRLKSKDQATLTAKKYLSTLKRRYGGKKLEQLLKKGIQAVSINNALNSTPKTAKIAHKQLLQDIVLDKKLLDVMSDEENMKKLKTRLEHRISIVNENGEEIIAASTFNKTTNQVIQEMQDLYRKNQEIKKDYNDQDTKRLKDTNYVGIQRKGEGLINRIGLVIIFRKAKNG